MVFDHPDANTVKRFRWNSDPERVAAAMFEATIEQRWYCIFDHAMFPGARFELNIPK